MRHYKRRWSESRGDAHDGWGASWWHFETDHSGTVLRQVEVYDAGPSLRYDREHETDAFGGLSTEPLAASEHAPFASSAAEFERAWSGASYGSRHL